MTVLCLAETDADGAADASLRALSFAAGVAGTAELAAVVFGPDGQVPRDALAAHGAARAYLIEPGDTGGYAPRAWPGPRRSRRWCSSPRTGFPVTRWPPTERPAPI